jgi:hypothetical protein
MSDPGSPSGYASDPTLEMLWGAPPAFTGDVGSVTAGSGGMPAITDEHVAVELGAVQAAEQSLLASADVLVNAYNPMNQLTQSAISGGTIYGQQATYNAEYNGKPETGYTNRPDTPVQQSAEQFAESINPAMTRLLRLIADATECMGVYIALLDKAGQAYTAADQNSMFPPPPPAPTATT